MRVEQSVLLLGASGVIGPSVLQALAVRGIAARGIRSSSLDLTARDATERLSRCLGPDTTLVVSTRSRGLAPREALLADVAMSASVADAIQRAPVRKCVFVSSLAVYDDSIPQLLTERTPVAPVTWYGASKAAAERVLQAATSAASVPLLIVRPCMVYGTTDRSRSYGPACFVESALAGGVVKVYGDGSERREYLLDQDVGAILADLAIGDSSGIYNVAPGATVSFQEIVSLMRRFLPHPFRVEHMPRARLVGDQKVDPLRLRAALPGLRFTSFEVGFANVCRAFVASSLAASTSCVTTAHDSLS